ncbi:MAG: nickel insertion protein [Desulfobaccales bacterium]
MFSKGVFREEDLKLTTPTGAAIVRSYVRGNGQPPPFKVERTGYGVGS